MTRRSRSPSARTLPFARRTRDASMASALAFATPPAATTRARVSRQPQPPPSSASGARSPSASRRAFLSASAASLISSRARPSRAADVASFVSLDALVANLRDAAAELALIEEALQTSVALGTDPPLKDLKKRLSSGAVADLPAAAVRLDRFIDAPELEDWEEAVWTSVSEETRGSRDIQGVTGRRLGNVERTNDFLCFVFSCFNDPRAPPSTDALLSLRLLTDGVAMGLRGDERITAEGLTLSVQDVREKLAAYADVVEASRISSPARAAPAR